MKSYLEIIKKYLVVGNGIQHKDGNYYRIYEVVKSEIDEYITGVNCLDPLNRVKYFSTHSLANDSVLYFNNRGIKVCPINVYLGINDDTVGNDKYLIFKLIQLRESLYLKFSYLNNEHSAKCFVENNIPTIGFLGNYSEANCKYVADEAKEYIKDEINKEFKELFSDITSEVKNYTCLLDPINISESNFENEAWGGVAIASGAALLGASVFPAFILGGAFFLGKRNYDNKKNLVSTVKAYGKNAHNAAVEFVKSEINRLLSILFIRNNNLGYLPANPTAEIDESNLDDNQKQIKEFIESRGIKWLIHFTDESNIESIKEHGLMPRSELNRLGLKYHFQDETRADHHLDCTSLSIGKKNDYLLKKYLLDRRMSKPVVIHIDARVLYAEKNNKIFCDRNAADMTCLKGSSVEDFKRMYADKIIKGENVFKRNNLRDYDLPTEEQAEILFQGNIDKKYLYFGSKNPFIDSETDYYDDENNQDSSSADAAINNELPF